MRRIATAGLLAWAGLCSAEAHAETGTGQATTSIVSPLSLVNTAPLAFGNLVPSTTSGTATVSVTGALTTTGGVISAGGTVSAASFTGVSGDAPPVVKIIGPPATITLNRVGGGASMTISNFVVEGGTGARNVGKNAVFTFRVGGQLNVGANQTPGVYTGSFNVTVDY
jgi:hypothetical protein